MSFTPSLAREKRSGMSSTRGPVLALFRPCPFSDELFHGGQGFYRCQALFIYADGTCKIGVGIGVDGNHFFAPVAEYPGHDPGKGRLPRTTFS